jgi:hypothetical protein
MRRRFTIFLVASALVLLAGLGPVAGQTQPPSSAPTGSGAPTSVPGAPAAPAAGQAVPALTPLSARWDPIPQVVPELSAAELYLEADDEVAIWVVRFRTGFPLPADGYRVSIVAGDPAGAQVRASLVVDGGAPTGVVEAGDGASWERAGDTGARFDPSGVVQIESPSDPVFSDPASSIWVTAEVPPGIAAIQSPVFGVRDLRGEGDVRAQRVATWGTVTDSGSGPTDEFIDGGEGPSVELRDDAIVLRLAAAPPADVRGNPVTDVVERVWVGPQTDASATLPYAITVNETRGVISLLDFSTGFPVTVGGTEAAWLVQGLPPGGTPPGPSELVFNLRGLSETLGFDLADPSLALALDRTVALVDGRRITYAGVTGLATWFAGEAAPTLEPIEEDVDALQPTTTVGAGGSGDSSSPNALVLGALALLLVVALIGGAVWLYARHRPPPEPPADQKEGRRAPVAGVSPDDALAALTRTVDEVAAKIDAKSATRVKTKSPPTPGSDRARAEAGPGGRDQRPS